MVEIKNSIKTWLLSFLSLFWEISIITNLCGLPPKQTIKKFVLGALENNVYLLVKEKQVVLIDCGQPAVILPCLEKNGLKLKMILLTHGHFDHVHGLEEIKERTKAEVWVNKKEVGLKYGGEITADKFFTDGQTIKFNGEEIKVIFTPGHTPGSVCFLVGNSLFSGDTLFKQGVGRTDLPGGNALELEKSLQRVLALPPETKVYPGHGEETSIGKEKLNRF